MSASLPPTGTAFAALRQFVRKRHSDQACELCNCALATEHQHLLGLEQRNLLCACDACAILFSDDGLKYKRVPRRIFVLQNFRMSDSQWQSMMIPIGLAFFYRSTIGGKTGLLYPSPAGAVESLLACETWEDIMKENPILKSMQADVEGLLVNRVAHARGEGACGYYLVPVDTCFRLVGLIRANWKGLSGGAEVWQKIRAFFDGLQASASWESQTPCA